MVAAMQLNGWILLGFSEQDESVPYSRGLENVTMRGEKVQMRSSDDCCSSHAKSCAHLCLCLCCGNLVWIWSWLAF